MTGCGTLGSWTRPTLASLRVSLVSYLYYDSRQKPVDYASMDNDVATTEKAILQSRRLFLQDRFPDMSIKQVLAHIRNFERPDGTRDGTCDTLFNNATPVGFPTYTRPGCEDRFCHACQYQYCSVAFQSRDIYAYERAVSDTEASILLKAMVDSVEADREWLRDVLVPRGNQFLNRWNKLKMYERKAIVGRVDGLEAEKWPQLNQYYNLNGDWTDKRKHRNAFLLPHLNVEALLEDRVRVLNLVYSRVEHAPHEFFHMDRGIMELGITSGILGRKYNAKCVVTTAESYGALRPWAKGPVHKGTLVGFPVAELVLIAQSVTMAALKKIVESTLATSQGQSGCDKWQSQGKERFGLIERSAERFGVMLLERPYGPPPASFQIEQAKTDIDGRLSVYKDAMSALQCEPDYAQLCIASLRKSKVFQTLPLKDQWASMSFFIYAWHWFAVIAWSYVATSSAALLEDATKHSEQLLSQDTISTTDLDGDLLFSFERSLSGAWIVSVRCLSLLMICKGTLDYGKYQNPNITMPHGKAFGKSTFGTASERQKLFDTDRLLWVLNELTRPEALDGAMPALDRGTLLSYLADILHHNAHKYKEIDEEIQMAIDDLLSIWELWRAVSPDTSFYLQISGSLVGQETLAEWYTSDDRELYKSHWNEAGPLLQAFSETPWPKGRKNEAWLDQAAKARTQLTMFWDSWRQYWRETLTTRPDTPKDSSVARKYPELQYLENDLQDSHRQECVQWDQTIRNGYKRKACDLTTQTGPVSSIPSGPETGSPEESYKKPKTGGKKAKKRPDTIYPTLAPGEAVPAVAPSPPPSPVRAPILVKQGSLDVFARMWPADSEDNKNSAVKWQTVLSAMTDAKCETTTNQGSMVNFGWKEPDATNMRRIQFHRPHGPGGNQLSALSLRRMGYRLTENFLWKWKRFQARARGDGGVEAPLE